jgi:hypothetical protein
MDRERLDGWCERGIGGLVLAVLVFGPLATGAVRTLELLVIQGLTILATVLWLARFWLNPASFVLAANLLVHASSSWDTRSLVAGGH